MPETNRALIEKEVRRRMAEHLASAGAPQGRVSLEVLYMLPPDFVETYVALFDSALTENLQTSGRASSDPVRAVRNRALRDSGKGQRERKVIGVYGRSSGRPYKSHWFVRSERMLKAKGSIDRKLERLAREIQGVLDDASGANARRQEASRRQADEAGGHPTRGLCETCSAPLGDLQRLLGAMLRWCPGCGKPLLPLLLSGSSPWTTILTELLRSTEGHDLSSFEYPGYVWLELEDLLKVKADFERGSEMRGDRTEQPPIDLGEPS